MITIINPPNPPGGVSNKDTMGGFGQIYPPGSKHSFPPLDMLHAAGVLRKKGITPDVIDCLGLGWDLGELLLGLSEREPSLIAIRTSAPTFSWDMRVARILKMTTPAKMIIFGPYVTLSPGTILEHPFVDAVITGEPEIAMSEIAARGNFTECEGVWYKQDDKIISNPPRALLADLDDLAFPAWDLVPYRTYDGLALMRSLRPFVTSFTSKGCPNGCAYCPYPVAQGRKWRTRSPENVLEELKWLTRSLGVKAVLFRDPEFAFQRQRVVEICEGISRQGLSLAWRCETRMEDLDEELIALMARSGCIGINMGVESADDVVLRKMNRKPLPLEQARRIIKACKKYEVDSFCFFVLGLPGETKEAALSTIRYALDLNPDFLQFTAATPYPGTPLRAWAEKNLFIENAAQGAGSGHEAAMRNEHMTSDEIRWLQWLAHEAREMRWKRISTRFLRSGLLAASELRRCLRFWRSKSRAGL